MDKVTFLYPLDVVGSITSSDRYYLGTNSILSSTTLGSVIKNSSLENVGTLTSLNVAGSMSVGDSTLASATISGSLSSGSTTINGILIGQSSASFTGDVSANSYKVGTSSVLTSNSLGTGITSSNLTSVGTLNSLNVSGTMSAGSSTLANVNISGSASASSLTISGTMSAGASALASATISGSISASSLTISGTISAGSSTLASAIISGSASASSLNVFGTMSAGASTLASATISGTLKLNNTTLIGSSNNYTLTLPSSDGENGQILITDGSGNLSWMNSGAITANPLFTSVTISGTMSAGASTITGTLIGQSSASFSGDLTANSYKIGTDSVLSSTTLGSGVTSSSLTSVGTLSSLTISGTMSAGASTIMGDITASSYKIGTESVLTSTSLGSNVTTSYLTSVGTLNSLSVTGNISGGDINSTGSFKVNGNQISTNNVSEGMNNLYYTDSRARNAVSAGTGISYSNSTGVISLSGTPNPWLTQGFNDIYYSIGNVGIGTSTINHKLDVSGNINVSTGNSYKINGTDVITSTGLGSGITSSSLTSVGTLSGLTVNGIISNQDSSNGYITINKGATSNRSGTIDFFRNNEPYRDGYIGYTTGTEFNVGIKVDSKFQIINESNTLLFSVTAPSSSTSITHARGNLHVGSSNTENYIAFNGLIFDGEGNFDHTYIGERLYNSSDNSELLLFKGNESTDRIRLLSGEIRLDTIDANTSGSFSNVGTANSTTRLFISNSGSVGIGTTSPSSDVKLHIAGSTFIQSSTSIYSRPSLSQTPISCEIRGISNQGEANEDGFLRLSAGGGFNASGLSYIDITGSYQFTSDLDKTIVFGTAGTERMRINNSGNIGVGTSSPNYKLDVSGNLNISSGSTYKINGVDVISSTGLGSDITSSSLTSVGILSSLNISGNLKINNTTITGSSNTYTLTLPSGTGSNGQVLSTDGSGNLSWTTVSGGGGGSSQWTTLNGNLYYTGGFIGLGMTNPESTLTIRDTQGGVNYTRCGLDIYNVSGSSTNHATMILRTNVGGFGDSTTHGNPTITFDKYYKAGWTLGINDRNFAFSSVGQDQIFNYTKMTITNNGAVGIGTTTPSQTLDVSGNITASSFITSSDIRIKKNIQSINTNELLNKINQIELKTYQYIDREEFEGKTVYGIIAQQVESILPEAVTIVSKYIPNIYKDADEVKLDETKENLIIKVTHDFIIGDNIKLEVYSNNSSEPDNYDKLVDVIQVIDSNHFVVKKWDSYDENKSIFVYGKKVNDFHVVDKSKLSLINIGATQELIKENILLKQKVTALETSNQDILSRLQAIENRLNNL